MTSFDLLTSDIESHEAFALVVRELHSHAATGRKNFVVRVPLDRVVYLISGVLQRSGLSKSGLERELSGLGLYGFRDAEGRIVRRYLSGETRMAWETFKRLLFWTMTKGWIREWAFRDLLLGAAVQEAAQLSARALLNQAKRRVSPSEPTQEQIVDCFYLAYRHVLQEIEAMAANRVRTDRGARELAHSLGLEFQD